ncbi:hypothetical protein [Streptomyces sp. MH60]|uniref:hypothetical protein n=1 Tax=Streptomyces sp. MH60 TaxID=1940758 RepID=UPI000CEE3FD7|nr:hypothetical protein [Streptomyces sp. MH60]PPS89412.1 hypothetical protein BZZ08_01558 [Streptomyces sp. MH60]
MPVDGPVEELQAAAGRLLERGAPLEEVEAFAALVRAFPAGPLPLVADQPAARERVSCDRCGGGELFDLLGHDAMGHRVANRLAQQRVSTLAELTSRSAEWLLDEARVGAKGFQRVRLKVGFQAWDVMVGRNAATG